VRRYRHLEDGATVTALEREILDKERAFTVGEANALLPHIRTALVRIREMRRSAGSLEQKLEQLQAVWGDEVGHGERKAGHPDHEEYVRYRRAIVAIDREIVEAIEAELTGRGIVVPLDGLERGIVHFPTTLGERQAYLCWALDEPEVRYWHQSDEGHSARRSVDVDTPPDPSPGAVDPA
jgi:hypothetical protein